jgi:hypothetical protein
MNTTYAETSYAILPDSWDELLKLDRPIDFQAFLKSDLLASERNHQKIVAIAYFVTGPISFIASAAIIYHILRSHKGLSSTYHRLVFGMCISDMMSSLAITLSTTMTPKEMSYISPFAYGNVALCTAQGALVRVGLYFY